MTKAQHKTLKGSVLKHPALQRSPEDYEAALSAFQRLYKFSRSIENPALAILAAYKGLQVLDREWAYDNGPLEDEAIAPASLRVPSWLREGMWLCLETFLAKPSMSKIGVSKRPKSFRQVLQAHLEDYQRWYLVYSGVNEGATVEAASSAASSQPGGMNSRTMRRAYDKIEDLIKSANKYPCEDGSGNPLTSIEPRDLIPTRKLAAIYKIHFASDT